MSVRTTARLVPLVLALAAVSAEAATVSESLPDIESLRIEHEKHVLPNGLTLLVHSDHSVPIVAVNSWYHVGSKDEVRGRTGFAHLFEHFFFNGSENHPHGFREAMDDLGANNRNGTTSTDRTNFFEDVPVSALERTLFLEADRLGFLAGNLSEEMLERERGVVQNEKRQRENRPYGRVFNEVVETIYPEAHPYNWPVIGSMADLEAATMEDISQWYETYYAPNNLVLSLAGDITSERALELVTKYYGDIPPGPPLTRNERWVPTLDADVRDSMEDRVPQARIYRAWHAPPWGDADLLRLQLFASVLSGSKSAPLDRKLVYDDQLATAVSAGAWERELSSIFVSTITVKPGVEPAAAEEAFESVLSDLLERGPSEEELTRAKARFVSGFARGLERLGGFGGRSDVLAESMTFGGDPDAYLEHLRVMTSATPTEVRDAARRWLRAHHYTMSVTPFPELEAGQTMVDRSKVPALGEPPEVTFPEIQRATLENGLEILLLERHSAPLVNATLVVDAGYSSDRPETAGLASLALGLLEEGTSERDGFELADGLDALGARISTDTLRDASLVRLRALSPTLEPSLELFAEVALEPSFPKDMVSLQVRQRLAAIEQEEANPTQAVQRVLPGILYGEEHPYAVARGGTGRAQTVAELDRKDLVDWHRAWFRPGSSSLVVAGDVTMKELKPLVEAAFGGWKKGEAKAKDVGAATASPAGTVYLMDKPDAPQSVIVAAHVSHPAGHERDLAREVLMRGFGGMSTSRLNRNLRLDKHWSYGTWGGISDARGPRPFVVLAPVQSDKTADAMREVRSEIRGVAGERPVTGEELESLMRSAVSRLPGRYETLAALESAAVDMVNFGMPESWFADYARNVRALTGADLAAAGRAFVRPDELTWIVMGDLEEVEPSVRELGFGEVVRIDAEGRVQGADTDGGVTGGAG